MFRKYVWSLAAAGVFAGVLGMVPPADAQMSAKAGFLTCQVDGGWGFVFGSSKKLYCTYSGSGRTERYEGSVSKFGVDVGYTQGAVIIWAVLAPTTNLAPGTLDGEYGGVSAGATVGVGAGVNLLVGGSNRTISLQPVSVEGNQGLNVAAGIAEVSLHHVK